MPAAAPSAVDSSLQAHKDMEMEALPSGMEEMGISGSATNSTGTNCAPLKHGAEDRYKLSHSSVERASIRSVIRSVRCWIVAGSLLDRCWSCVPRRLGRVAHFDQFPSLALSTVAVSRSVTLPFTRRKRRTAAPLAIRPNSVTGCSAQSLWWGP